jgi:16S rRNA (uracil1498-N3)-methyltransferase
MRRRFFVDRFERESASLRNEAAEHLGRVLRAEPGQLYELSDGQRVWLARVEHVAVSKRGPSRIDFALVEPIQTAEPAFRTELLISIVKFDRFEWCLEKATELGVAEIVPLAAARTDKALIAAAAKRSERWNRILMESAQQSRRLSPPILHAALPPDKAFAQSSASLKVLLSERREAKSLRKLLDQDSLSVAQALLPAQRNEGPVRFSSVTDAKTQATPTISLAVGPEGGWTEDEITSARAAGFLEASLGENILRTETAVIASLAVVQFALATR